MATIDNTALYCKLFAGMRTLFLILLITVETFAINVASLHPLITDAVQQVGGDRINIVQIGKPGMNVHTFRPRPRDVQKLAESKLIFASGKGLETYLDKIKKSLKDGQAIVEVGAAIPSQKVSFKEQIYACCPNHAVGGVDPHWWHNVNNMSRAIRVIEKQLIKADPAGKTVYTANSKAARKRLKALHRWVKAQVANIPKNKRHLVTAHAAFGYFCKTYGFKATYVQGLSADGEIPAARLATSIAELRKNAILAVFPEQKANPKVLQQIARQSGAKIGKPLIADGSVGSYQAMIQSNVTSIVNGLAK